MPRCTFFLGGPAWRLRGCLVLMFFASVALHSTDADGDGLSDAYETDWGLNPNNADTDGDGVADGRDAIADRAFFKHPRVSAESWVVVEMGEGSPVHVLENGTTLIRKDFDNEEEETVQSYYVWAQGNVTTLPNSGDVDYPFVWERLGNYGGSLVAMGWQRTWGPHDRPIYCFVGDETAWVLDEDGLYEGIDALSGDDASTSFDTLHSEDMYFGADGYVYFVVGCWSANPTAFNGVRILAWAGGGDIWTVNGAVMGTSGYLQFNLAWVSLPEPETTAHSLDMRIYPNRSVKYYVDDVPLDAWSWTNIDSWSSFGLGWAQGMADRFAAFGDAAFTVALGGKNTPLTSEPTLRTQEGGVFTSHTWTDEIEHYGSNVTLRLKQLNRLGLGIDYNGHYWLNGEHRMLVHDLPAPYDDFDHGEVKANAIAYNSPTIAATWDYDPENGPAVQKALLLTRMDLEWRTMDYFDAPLEDNPNAGGGKRYFPDKTHPEQQNVNNLVQLRIRMPGFAGKLVKLTAFDVDDPYVGSNTTQTAIVDPNGPAGGDNLDDYLATPKYGGFFISGSTYAENTTVTLDENGEAEAYFRVGMQPGNNYRVAAALNTNLGNFTNLQVADSGASYYIPSGDGQVNFGGTGALSPMLTVWRKLHLEFDAMEDGPPETGSEKNTVSGTILLTHDNEPTSGKSRLVLNQILSNGVNSYAGGTITVEDFGEYSILENTLGYYLPEQRDRVTISAVPGNGTIDKSFVLRDDDDRYLEEVGAPAFLANTPSGEDMIAEMQFAFSPACIQLVDAKTLGLDDDARITFYLNQSSIYPLGYSIFTAHKEVADSSGFWAHTVCFAYQDIIGKDGDPVDESCTLGTTPDSGVTYSQPGYSVIYVEGIRERSFLGLESAELAVFDNNEIMHNYWLAYYGWLYGVIAHEIGHAPSSADEDEDHAEGFLMKEGASRIDQLQFSGKTIRRFRATEKWNR